MDNAALKFIRKNLKLNAYIIVAQFLALTFKDWKNYLITKLFHNLQQKPQT
jgi:hypothetical protein